ncbi:DASH complex subunit spc19 [Elasticomyces elasticus]|nr:DASH complex subunit spc19 [Elasticomyces elasticus]
MHLLDSSINILDTGVSDYPRLAKVLQTTRHFELVSEHDLVTAQASLLSELQPEVEGLLSRVETHLNKLERREQSLIAKAELQEGRLSRTSAGGARSRNSSATRGSIGRSTSTAGEAGLSALEEVKLQQLKQKKERLSYASGNASRIEHRSSGVHYIATESTDMVPPYAAYLAVLVCVVGIFTSTCLAILVTVLLLRKPATVPIVAPANIKDIKKQILANAALLYPASKQPELPNLAIAVLSDEPTDAPREGSRQRKGAVFRAALLLVQPSHSRSADGEDESEGPGAARTLLRGSPAANLGEAMNELLVVTAAALEDRIGDRQRGRTRERKCCK